MGSETQRQQEEIRALKQRWGGELLILAHHYQRPEVVQIADGVGDSFELARLAAEASQARTIVFCGVRFMAEAAEVLRRPGQKVLHPVAEAGCPLADFAQRKAVENALTRLQAVRGSGTVMPVTYMNSSADIKALVGRAGGCVCTSSNAGKIFSWALDQRPVVLFVPDRHLGENTAAAIGIPAERVAVWDPGEKDGGLGLERLQQVQVVLWRGHCHVHTAFSTQDIVFARVQFPDARVLVHPECGQDVVREADSAGSTSVLVRQVSEAPSGSRWFIGTETHLVERLGQDLPDRTVLPLRRSVCRDMARIGLSEVLDCLHNLPQWPALSMDAGIREGARLALQRMLSIA